MTRVAKAGGVRDRLIEVADRLFYREGIRAVGIDRVLADADAAKASLYAHFGSKDELVAAFVARRVAHARESLARVVADVPPADRALRVFDWVVTWTGTPGFRGCPLQHVAGELADPAHPARDLVRDQRRWLQARFTEWAAEAGALDPSATADALVVIFDGTVAASELDGPARARAGRRLAELVLREAARPAPGRTAAVRAGRPPRRARARARGPR